MAATGINVSLDSLTETANKISAINGKMTSCLQDVQLLVSDTIGIWSSPSADIMRGSMRLLGDRFLEIYSDTEMFSAFLNNAVAMYLANEQEIDQAAQTFSEEFGSQIRFVSPGSLPGSSELGAKGVDR